MKKGTVVGLGLCAIFGIVFGLFKLATVIFILTIVFELCFDGHE